MTLDEHCLDNWLSDYEAFRREFLEYVYFYSKALGYYPQVDFEKLKAAYDSWVAEVGIWQQSLVMPNSNGLSHLKIMAIMLTNLASVDWVKELEDFDPTNDRREGDFHGTVEEQQETRDDIDGGRGTFLAYQFTMDILNSFESSRDDRTEPFKFRMTTDLEHDIMVFLTSDRRDSIAVFLIFKALYARD